MLFWCFGLRLTFEPLTGPSPSVRLMKISLVVAGLSLAGLSVLASACNPSRVGSMDPKMDDMVQKTLAKMGVPGESSKPNPVAKSLDCPAIKSVIKQVEDARKPISSASVEGLNAWTKWCGLPTTKVSGV